ncbi:MAG: thioredoxin domain-containing protein [Patescibacteria group bacterium]|nr:thioredoxin domain-containing protein [Patescibacteria group bacterium]MDD5715734.1 thioredoxin domain-containing protein [Patescibacteria group bacterium]
MEPMESSKPVKKRAMWKWWLVGFGFIFLCVASFAVYFYVLVRQNINNVNGGVTGSVAQKIIQSADDPYMGGENAQVVIVEFADFFCPYCNQAFPVIRELASVYGDDIKIIYRDLPTAEAHIKASEAAECAHEQGRFWEMHDKLFQNQVDLSVTAYKNFATQIGLDFNRFSECLDSGKYADEVQADFADGYIVGATSTPTFFINGRKFQGTVTFAEFQTIIDQLLSIYASSNTVSP